MIYDAVHECLSVMFKARNSNRVFSPKLGDTGLYDGKEFTFRRSLKRVHKINVSPPKLFYGCLLNLLSWFYINTFRITLISVLISEL
jgi:hypothetical protein